MPRQLISTDTPGLSGLENFIGLGPIRKARFETFGPVGECYWTCDRYVQERREAGEGL